MAALTSLVGQCIKFENAKNRVFVAGTGVAGELTNLLGKETIWRWE
jgi:hypothetical protein